MIITFAALHTAKRAGTLPALLAAMTSAQRVEAAQVCAANSQRSVSHWLAVFGALMEADGVAAALKAAEDRDQAALRDAA
jgi:hypothetical protein